MLSSSHPFHNNIIFQRRKGGKFSLSYFNVWLSLVGSDFSNAMFLLFSVGLENCVVMNSLSKKLFGAKMCD
jgi:hypothetical protein